MPLRSAATTLYGSVILSLAVAACSSTDGDGEPEATDAGPPPSADSGASNGNIPVIQMDSGMAGGRPNVCQQRAGVGMPTFAACTTPPDDGAEVVGLDRCRPIPKHMAALGDSVASCIFSGPSQACASAELADHLRKRYSPELTYQDYAVPGSRTVDLLAQARMIGPCTGHLLVWIFTGGNDLASCQMPDMEQTRTCVDALLQTVPARWKELFSYFSDRQRFPDGVTFLLNTQYSLYDTCRHQFNRPAFAEEQIMRFNQAAELAPAMARDDTIAVDHFPDFLGHARAALEANCPHYDANDAVSWLFDGTHPNHIGHCQIAGKSKAAVDRMYDCAAP